MGRTKTFQDVPTKDHAHRSRGSGMAKCPPDPMQESATPANGSDASSRNLEQSRSRRRSADRSESEASRPGSHNDMPGSSQRSPSPEPGTGSTRTYFLFGNSVPVLRPAHDLDQEGTQFRAFMALVEQQCPPSSLPSVSKYFETDHGIWLPTIVRYANIGQRFKAIKSNADKDFWKHYNFCPPTLEKPIRALYKETEKPICVILHGQTGGIKKDKVNSVLLALVKVNGVRVAYVKDPMPTDKMIPMTRLIVLLKYLCQHSFSMIGMLGDDDAYSPATDSLRESYKTVGDILDGNPFWNRKGAVTRRFKVTQKPFVV